MTRSAEAKAWDVLVRETLAVHGWKITAGGYGSRRTPRNLLSSSLLHNSKDGVVRGSIGITPLAFEAVARDLERTTELARSTVVDLPARLVMGDDIVLPVNGDLATITAVAADELHRRSVELDERFATLVDYEPHLDSGGSARAHRLIWTLARGDTSTALELARAWIDSPDHHRNDFRRPSARSLPLHVIEWLDPVPVTHAVTSPHKAGASPLQVPWADVPTVLAGVVRPAPKQRPSAYIVWPVPDGEDFSPSMESPGLGYIQTVGRGDEWTVEVNRLIDGQPRSLVIGRAGNETGPDEPDIEIPWQQTSVRIRPHECLATDEVVAIFTGWVARGAVDPTLTQRPIDVP